ncbi:hypothetical protein ACOZ38_28870 [Sphaerisporangium viridialbum]|uniref:hypothetical protein n=1 Tax=Sphaerisporangium viridialbum TaxID=46189 RepID=UPI003C742658
MTPTTTVSARQLIEKAAKGQYRTVCTPSVLDAAAKVLADLHTTGQRHGIASTDWVGVHGSDNRLAEALLAGWATACRRASLGDLDDPLALLTEAAQRAGLAIMDARAAGNVDAGAASTGIEPHRVSIRLARLPQTPPWGRDGVAPLVVSLDRFDDQASPAWKWELSPGIGEPSTQMVQVVTSPPSPTAADEVLAVAHQVLTGALRLYR